MNQTDQGFQEIEHTADLALRVWALNLPDLFKLSAEGMYALLEIDLESNKNIEKIIELDTHDNEELLVIFLNEILFFSQSEKIGFYSIEIILGAGKLKALCLGAKILNRKNDIKAVTFHNIEIINQDGKYIVDLVFDV